MRIVTRITRTENGQYLYNDRLFSCFVDARREMGREKTGLLAAWTQRREAQDIYPGETSKPQK